MSVETPLRVTEVAELVRSGQYRVDTAAVAQAMVSRIIWDDVPDLMSLDTDGSQPRSPRLRGLVKVRRLIAAPVQLTVRLGSEARPVLRRAA